MRNKTRIAVDAGMTLSLLFLISYGLAAAIYGVYAFYKRSIWQYMFLISQFVFFDYSEPVIFFFLDYIAVMWMFAYIGNAVMALLKKRPENKNNIQRTQK